VELPAEKAPKIDTRLLLSIMPLIDMRGRGRGASLAVDVVYVNDAR
jgi:hypothetical protein